MRSEDQELMQRSQQGDREAFDRLGHDYQARLTAFCADILRSARDGKEAAEETLALAWEQRDSCSFEGSVGRWLYRIARNLCLNRLRPSGVSAALEDLEYPLLRNRSDPATRSSEAPWFQMSEALKRRLNDRERLVCRLHYQLGCSAEEIAALLQMNRETVRSQLLRKVQPAVAELLREFDYR
jgi:RNA polymerase sigma-70 factor (ECF subfamily)